MKYNKRLQDFEKVAKIVEIAVAVLLLVVVVVKIIEIIFELIGYKTPIMAMEFDRVLSITLNIVIGVEFIRMLIKHTPESVIDVLLFAIARQMVVYHENTQDLLIGVAAIAGLFAVKKYLSDANDI